jgi:pimeloyl-ACP methyl ester carboxylesterase
MTGQMFVQFQVPQARRHRVPIVMWHGGGQTGANFLGTPDGRPGWAEFFVRQGYAVYVVDQPGRARSGFFTDAYGRTRRPNARSQSQRFTAPAMSALYPQASRHTQWPGAGVAGDPVFDQFFASQVEDIEDLRTIEMLNRDAGSALLDRIGPAIVLTHSQSGPFGWALADARPRLVRAIIAVEPNGPPFHDNVTIGAPDWFKDGPLARPWGITRLPLTYSPPVSAPGEMRPAREARAERPDLVRCWAPSGEARQLVNLQRVPVVIVTAEASYHAPYDHCTSRYLRHAGVTHGFVRLPDVGIAGNGHMMMLERNNLAIAAWLERWAAAHAG